MNSAPKLPVARQKYGKTPAPGAISRPFGRLLQITIISFSIQLAANAAPTFSLCIANFGNASFIRASSIWIDFEKRAYSSLIV